MKKAICFIVLLAICCSVIYGFDVDFSWSFGYIKVANSNFENNVNFHLGLLNFNWIEKNTGLGLGFSLFEYYGLPVEIMWHPFSNRIGSSGIYGTLGFYNKIGFGSADTSFLREIIRDLRLVNNIGIRYIFSTEPFGRNTGRRSRRYHRNVTVFAEYSMFNTWRVGISADVLFLFSLPIYSILFITERPIPE